MQLCLVIMCGPNDADFLRLHLPVIAPAFDGIVAVVDPADASHATTLAILALCPDHARLTMVRRTFDHDWSAQVNAGIEAAEREGYDAAIRLDPDELMFPAEIDALRRRIEASPVSLWFHRYNFFFDRLHYNTGAFPDFQGRAFMLNRGVRYVGRVHEQIPGDGSLDAATIYHYGDIGPNVKRRQLHYINIERRNQGLLPFATLPHDTPPPSVAVAEFTAEQPLDPFVIGTIAPFVDEVR